MALEISFFEHKIYTSKNKTTIRTFTRRCLDNTHFGAIIGAIVVAGGRRGPMVKDGRKILFFTKIILQKEMTLRSNK